jgi:putative SOS response-associated peptidase YedK
VFGREAARTSAGGGCALHTQSAYGSPCPFSSLALASSRCASVKWCSRRACATWRRSWLLPWSAPGPGKRPYRIALKTEGPFAFAGLWSTIHHADGQVHPTFAILTTEANELVAHIHNRMPVILRPEDEEHWLDQQWPVEAVQELLVPFPAGLMTAYEVSAKVNSPAYNTPEAIRALVHETS